MTTEHQREQEERRRILLEGTTMQQFAQSQADEINQGRFAATGVPNVIGASILPEATGEPMSGDAPPVTASLAGEQRPDVGSPPSKGSGHND
jgi:hypothetical protein